MSQTCFELALKRDVNNTVVICCSTKLTKWLRTRLSHQSLTFAAFMLKHSSWNLMFVICDIPNFFTYTAESVNLFQNVTLVADIPLPDAENRELFSIHAFKHLSQTGQVGVFDRFCCYCGLPLCFKNHFGIKFLEIFDKEGIWQFLSPTVGFSEVFLTNQQFKSEKKLEVIFMVDLKINCVTVHTKTTEKVSKDKFYPDKFMELFTQKHAPKNALPLSTCCLKTLLDNNYPFTELYNVFPSFVVNSWEIVKHYETMKAIRNKKFSKTQLRQTRVLSNSMVSD